MAESKSDLQAQQTPQTSTILRMAVANPLLRLFDYLPLTQTNIANLTPGMRFIVPFGSRKLPAYLISIESSTTIPHKKLKTIIEQTDIETPSIDNETLNLLIWCSKYYHHNLGQCIQNALPKKLRQGAPTTLEETLWKLSNKGLGLGPQSLKNAKKQRAIISHLQKHGTIDTQTLKKESISKTTLKSLLEKELIEETKIAPEPQINSRLLTPQLKLNTEQAQTLNAISSEPGFNTHLLYGVTGSGKTEVYLQAIAQVLKQGKQALVLIPEISLTPQTLERFTQRFETPVICLHSKLSEGQRYKHWLQAKQALAGIVIGTRSAVFTPFHNLGMIIVDEEHDNAYKQQSGFQYSAKDVAIRRAQQLNIPIILGSATPSCESIYNAQIRRYQHHALLQRANNASSPKLSLLDMNNKAVAEGFLESSLSKIQHCLDKKQQVIVFINRRGFAPTILCQDCNWTSQCPHCDARLTLHKKRNLLICHHCHFKQMMPKNCPNCRSNKLKALGIGTQRSEEFLNHRFSNTPIYRIDRDSTQQKDNMLNITNQLADDEPAILIGTQMLAKGHHFPNVTLVLILDSDSWLFANDFRGEERMAQLITQVSGRAGRAQKPGETIIQTHLPDHPFWGLLFKNDYRLLSGNILEKRLATAMPPYTHLVLFRAEHKQAERVVKFLQHCRQWLEANMPEINTLGPYPSSLMRKANVYRFQLQLKHAQRRTLHTAIDSLLEHLSQQRFDKSINWHFDIDPQDLN